MKKALICLMSVLLVSICVIAHAEVIETASTVTKAIIYTSSAQVTREVSVNPKEGFNEVVLKDIPENLDETTLTVSAKGQAKAKILDAKIKRIYLEKPQSEAVQKLEDEIQALEDKIMGFNNQQGALQEEKEFIRSIKLYAGQQIPEDLVTKMPKPEELGSLDNFINAKWQEIFKKEFDIRNAIRDANKTLTKLRRELQELQGARGKEAVRTLVRAPSLTFTYV